MIQYFPGEDIVISTKRFNSADKLSDEQINQKYAQGEIRIVTEQARYPLPSIPGMIQSNNYNLSPEFQRRHRWSLTQQSRLIESFIMNIPIPPIFLYEIDYSKYEVMDGLQRLSAIDDFYSDKFKLKELEFWHELEGKTYSQLPSNIKNGIDRRFISSVILLKETAKDEETAKMMKQIVFERINSGGTPLEYQESRNAFYAGPFNELCKTLSRNPTFCELFNIPKPTADEIENNLPGTDLLKCDAYKKMRDVEHVVRFFAMRYVNDLDIPLKTFLDIFTGEANKLSSEVLSCYSDLFTQTIQFVYDLLGKHAFGIWRQNDEEPGGWEFKMTPNTFVYDPIMYVLSQRLEERESLLAQKEAIRELLKQLYINEEILRDGRKSSKVDILKRIEIFTTYFKKFA